ncbi:hypothetical protein StrepF001_23220 [Streptomyces sp. F001]|uniref:hypothetical protein n=1 Tax=Streptomyces sp. F001 TaxID=1510026 RepID=UPI00101E597D|nr:hypothetical protein [Streptomyces sp. F001]RZB16853.1 hypothetical protein StrepF001_23220 [Streptomyces sp. F001]
MHTPSWFPTRRALTAVLPAVLLATAGCGDSTPGGDDGTRKPRSGPSASPSSPSPSPTPTRGPVSPVGDWTLSHSDSGSVFYVLTVEKNRDLSMLGRPRGGGSGSGTDLCFGDLTAGPDPYKVKITCVNTDDLKPGRPKTDVFEGTAVISADPIRERDTFVITWGDGSTDHLTKRGDGDW